MENNKKQELIKRRDKELERGFITFKQYEEAIKEILEDRIPAIKIY